MVRGDLKEAREVWLDSFQGARQRTENEHSGFLVYRDSAGLVCVGAGPSCTTGEGWGGATDSGVPTGSRGAASGSHAGCAASTSGACPGREVNNLHAAIASATRATQLMNLVNRLMSRLRAAALLLCESARRRTLACNPQWTPVG